MSVTEFSSRVGKMHFAQNTCMIALMLQTLTKIPSLAPTREELRETGTHAILFCLLVKISFLNVSILTVA